jgi:hypothetical protein
MGRPTEASLATADETPRIGPEEAEQRPAHPFRRGIAAFALFLTGSVLVWGIPVIGHLGSRYIAYNMHDPDFYRWALAWTPWALAHGHSPVFTDMVFAPHGVSLAWSAFVPGPALLMWPVTHVFGTLVAYNLLTIAAPALAAWAVYLLAHRVTASFWPSVAGGALFGLSAYVTGQIQHVNLVLAFPIPLAAYLVVRRIEGSLGPRAFVAWLALDLLGLFTISSELFATSVVFGGIAFVIALIASGSDRPTVARSLVLTVIAYAIVGAVVFVPYLLPVLREKPPNVIRPIERTSVDLLGLIVPRDRALVGGTTFSTISERFPARPIEDAGYLGIPLIVMLVAFAVSERRRRGTWALLSFVVVTMILSFGPILHIDGRKIVAFPGRILAATPIVQNATAQRFPMYASIVVGVMGAIWLARGSGVTRWIRWAVVALAIVALLPRMPVPPWFPEDRTPAFITNGTFRSWIQPGENVLPITIGRGEELVWQAEADFWFRVPEGYIGLIPRDVFDGKLSRGLQSQGQNFVPDAGSLDRWLAERDVNTLVMADGATATFAPVVSAAGYTPVFEGDGVSVWRRASTPTS